MSVRIIVDSTADFKEGLQERFSIVPLTVRFGEVEFVQGVTLDNRQFYEKLVESDILPTTSQATPDAFDRAYRPVVERGDDAVVITVSSKLSGTYQSAKIAAEEYEDRVFVVDSGSVAIGAGILAELALRYAETGKTAREIAALLEEDRKNIQLIAVLDTLEYLKKGGRISPAVAFAGGLLSIKPVVCIDDGEIKILGKARGSKQGNNFLMQQIQACGGVDFSRPVLLGYTGLSDAYLLKYIEDSSSVWASERGRLDYTIIGSVVGTHAGPGAIAVAFFKK